MDYRRGEDRSDYTDRCRCFKRDQTTLENIKKGDGVSFATFYKKDLVPFGYQKVWNGDHTSAATFFQGTVQTLDDVSALRPDDFVENEDGEVYRVIAPIISVGGFPDAASRLRNAFPQAVL